MKVLSLHSWNLPFPEARKIQAELAKKVVRKNHVRAPEIVAGMDIGFTKESAYAGVVLLNAKTLEVIDEIVLKGEINFPYVPGLLSFREAPLLLELLKNVSQKTDLIFFDGHGVAHPRGLGLASHMGLFLNCPTVGCGKSKLIGHYSEPGVKKGSHSQLLDKKNASLGAVLRTRDNCKPIFVSVGHKIDLKTAVHWTLQCTTRYRIPEPTRRAHNLVTAARKSEA